MTTPPELPPDHAPRVRFERRDINARILLLIGLGTCVCLALIHVGMQELFHLYRVQENKLDSLPSPLMTVESQRAKPFATLQEVRSAEDSRLNGYGWIDREKQKVRIPIDRAMEITAERGLPDWQEKGELKLKAKQGSEPEHKP